MPVHKRHTYPKHKTLSCEVPNDERWTERTQRNGAIFLGGGGNHRTIGLR